MGMYDNLGEYQVKTFYVPVFYNSDYRKNSSAYSMGYIGGELRCFDAGDEVPIRTLWYNLPPNFIIADLSMYDQKYDVFHCILNGKYDSSYEIPELIPEDVFKKVSLVVNYIGDPIPHLLTKIQLIDYTEKLREHYRMIDGVQRKSVRMLGEIQEKRKNGAPQEEIDALLKVYTEQEDADLAYIREIYKENLSDFILTQEEQERAERKEKLSLFGAYIDIVHHVMHSTNKSYDKDGYKEHLLEEGRRLYREIDFVEYLGWIRPSFEERKIIMDVVRDYLA